MTLSARASIAERVERWRQHGDRAAADALVVELRDELREVCWDLGLLYADEQATQAVEAALQVANPMAAPARWRRRNPGVVAGEWTSAPDATFRALCIHALLDNAAVPVIDGRRSRLPAPHRAALRLDLADVHDAREVAELLGIPRDRVLEFWDGVDLGDEPTGRRRRRRIPGLGTVFSTVGSSSGALAAVSAGTLAATAVVIAVAASTVAIQRAGVPGDVPAQIIEVPPPRGVVPDHGAVPPAGSDQEGVEAPLAPDEARPGLNVPTVDVPTVELEDVLPDDLLDGGLLDGDLPDDLLDEPLGETVGDPLDDLLDEPLDDPLDGPIESVVPGGEADLPDPVVPPDVPDPGDLLPSEGAGDLLDGAAG